MWRGLLLPVSVAALLGDGGSVLWLECSVGQELEDLLQGQLGLWGAEIQPQQPPLARSSPVDGRSASLPGRCFARGTRLHDFAIFDSAHFEEKRLAF